jgi:hypothetical protein
VECVRERPGDLGEQLEVVDREARFAALRPRRTPRDSEDVAEVDIEAPHPIALDEQLDLPTPVNDIEEDELSEVAPGHYAPGKTKGPFAFGSGFQVLSSRASIGDGVAF